jgi:hypothetical protein
LVRLEPVESRRLLGAQLTWFLVWLAVTLIGLFLLRPDPSGHGTHTQLGLPPCPSMLVTGKPCPGCGLTTSFTASLHGNFDRAFAAHPFGPFLYLVLTAIGIGAFVGWVRRARVVTHAKWSNLVLIVFFGAFLSFGIFRFFTAPAESTAITALKSVR